MSFVTRDSAALNIELRDESHMYEELRNHIKALPGQPERSPLPERIARGMITHRDTLVEALRFVKMKNEKLREEQAPAIRHATTLLVDWWEHSGEGSVADHQFPEKEPSAARQLAYNHEEDIHCDGNVSQGSSKSLVLMQDIEKGQHQINGNYASSPYSDESSIPLSENAFYSEHDDVDDALKHDTPISQGNISLADPELLHRGSHMYHTSLERPFTVPVQEKVVKMAKSSPYQKSSMSWRLREQLESDERSRRLAALAEHAERRRRGSSKRQSYLAYTPPNQKLHFQGTPKNPFFGSSKSDSNSDGKDQDMLGLSLGSREHLTQSPLDHKMFEQSSSRDFLTQELSHYQDRDSLLSFQALPPPETSPCDDKSNEITTIPDHTCIIPKPRKVYKFRLVPLSLKKTIFLMSVLAFAGMFAMYNCPANSQSPSSSHRSENATFQPVSENIPTDDALSYTMVKSVESTDTSECLQSLLPVSTGEEMTRPTEIAANLINPSALGYSALTGIAALLSVILGILFY